MVAISQTRPSYWYSGSPDPHLEQASTVNRCPCCASAEDSGETAQQCPYNDDCHDGHSKIGDAGHSSRHLTALLTAATLFRLKLSGPVGQLSPALNQLS